LLYTCCLIVGLAIFCKSTATKYLLVYLPFLCILMAIGIHAIYDRAQSLSKYARYYIVPFAVGAYLLGSYTTILIFVAHNHWDMLASQRALAAYMRPGSRVVVPITFTLSAIERYTVQGLDFYDILRERRLIPASMTPFQYAARSGNEYLVVDQGCITKWHLADASSFGEYELIHKEPVPQGGEQYWVFRRRIAGTHETTLPN
jgi:hypothetical protein